MENMNIVSRGSKMQEIAMVKKDFKGFSMSLETLIERKDMPISKESNMVTTIDIAVSNDIKNRKAITIDVVPMDKSCFTINTTVNADVTYVLVDGIKKAYELYTNDYIQVTIDKSLLDEFNGKTLFYSPSTGNLYVVGTKRTGKYLNLTKNTQVTKLPKDVVEYDTRVSIVTAGTLKKATFYCAKVTKETYLEFINSKVKGAFSNIKKTFDNAGQVMKFLTRPGIAITGQNPMFELDSFAVVEDLSGFNYKEKDGSLSKKGFKKADGITLFDASLIRKSFGLRTIRETIGLHFQCRTDKEAVSKVQGIPTILIPETLENQPLDPNGNLSYRIFTKDGQPRALEEVQAIFDLNGIKAMGLELDVNGIVNNVIGKFDTMTVNVMSISKLTEGRMSKQAFEPIAVAAAKRGKDSLKEAENFILDNFEKMMAKEANLLTKAEVTSPQLSCNYILEVIKSCVPFAPLGLRTRKEQLLNMFARVVDKLAVTITDYKGRNCMFNVVVCPDLALSVSNKGIIPAGCVIVGKFSKELARLEDKFGRDSEEYKEYEAYCGKVIGFKYPKMHFEEFLDAKVVNLNDITEIINSRTDLSDSLKSKLIFQYTNICDAVIMLPDDKDLMKKCAGLDFDWDKITILLPSNYTFILDLLYGNSLLVNIETKTVKEEDTKKEVEVVDGRGGIFNSLLKKEDASLSVPTDKEVVLDIDHVDFFWSSFSYAIKNLGNIGQITNWNNTVIGMLVQLYRGNDIPAKKFLMQLYGNTNGGKKAVYSVDDTVVDVLFVDRMLEEMKNCKWTNPNIALFLNDCCKVFRLYQEGTIDSSKTGIYLAIILQCLVVKAKSLLPVYTMQVEDENGVKHTRIVRKSFRERKAIVKRMVNGVEISEELDVYLMTDFISEIQDKMINLTETVFETFFDEIKDKFTWNSEDVMYIGEVFDHASAKYSDVVSKLRTLNGIYISSLGQMINAKNKVIISQKYEDKQLDKKIKEIEEVFNLKVRSISSTANRIMSKVKENFEYKGALAMAVSMLKNGGINPASNNRFGIAMFPAEVYSFILGEETSTIRCEGKILQYGDEDNTVGTTVFVTRGVSKNGLILNDIFTGTITIGEKNIAYADKSLESLGVVGGYDENSYTIVLKANDVNKNLEDGTFMEAITGESVLHITKKGVYFSPDLDTDFDSISMNAKTNVLTDVEVGVDYSVKSSYEVELYLGERDIETDETIKTKCYIVELQK